MNSKAQCFYCGSSDSSKSGEHVIADTIGGRDVVGPVCKKCNNGELSKLDTELCSRSPLSLVAAAELQDLRVVSDLWTIDERQNKLLIEGQWDPARSTHLIYPQLIIEGERAQLRADASEIHRIGQGKFQEIFVEAAKFAYQEYINGRHKLFFEPVDRRLFPKDNRLPPRIFSRHRLTDLKVGDTFVLKYVDEADKKHLLHKLSVGKLFEAKGRAEFYLPGNTLAFQVMYSPATVGRAFMKLGLNTLRWVCEKTPIDCHHFSTACDLILGKVIDDRLVEDTSGFVNATDLVTMECADDEHRLWVVRDGNNWVVRASFFGGRIGGITSFAGPSLEDWNFADIICPLNGKMEVVRKSFLYVAGKVPIQTSIFNDIAPSIEALNSREERFFVKRKKSKK